MKFTWFHLMPYRWLPADFRERYHSVWVDLPNGIYDPEKGHDLYNEYLDMLEYAEQCGFDAIAVNEHHQNAYGLTHEHERRGVVVAAQQVLGEVQPRAR